jgi:hypothetical protein
VKGPTKRCGACRQERPLDDFAQRARSRDGRQGRCRVCYALWYRANAAAHTARVAERKAAQRGKVRSALMAYLLAHPCVDCGEADPRCLDFDHCDPAAKRASISRMVGYASWARILVEIEKCDVRCANCHRKRTAQQFKWWNAIPARDLASGQGR